MTTLKSKTTTQKVAKTSSTSKRIGRPIGSASKGMQVTAEPPVHGRRIMFRYDGEPGHQVFIAGIFNGWKPGAKQLVDSKGTGEYRCGLNLKPGHYEYKLIIDGVWCLDEKNPNTVENDLGTLNNVIDIQ